MFSRIAKTVPGLKLKLKQAGMEDKPEDFCKNLKEELPEVPEEGCAEIITSKSVCSTYNNAECDAHSDTCISISGTCQPIPPEAGEKKWPSGAGCETALTGADCESGVCVTGSVPNYGICQ